MRPGDPPDPGAVLLVSRFRPIYAVFTLSIGLALVLVAADGFTLRRVTPEMPDSARQGALGILFFFGLLAVSFGLAQLIRPRVFVTATRDGLVVYRQERGPGPSSFLIPWGRILALETEIHALPTGLRRARATTVAVRVEIDDEWRVPPGFSHFLKPLPEVASTTTSSEPENGRQTVHVDASTGAPGGGELCRRLREIWEEHR